MADWISVADQMPEERQRVLCWHSKRQTVGLHEFYHDWNHRAHWDGVRATDMDVTHWMPLPEGPSGMNLL